MNTQVVSAKLDARKNNFNIVRLFAALLVLIGHMGPIMGIAAPVFAGFTLHELGVTILFLIGGYLISVSWLSDTHYVRFQIKRFFRLWPPFAVMVILVAFVAGPMLSTLPARDYFASWYTVYLQNLRFFIIYALPGVFTDTPIPNVVNGSLWTMPVEAALYLITPIVLTILRVKRKSKASFYATAAVVVAACAADLYFRTRMAGQMAVFYATDWIAAWHLIVFYLIGMLFTYDEMKRLLNVQAALAGLCLQCLLQYAPPAVRQAALFIILPYAVFSIALAPAPLFYKVGSKYELSYGIYLYGFFFQQLVVRFSIQRGLEWDFYVCLLLSLALTVVAAWISCVAVEKPCLKLSYRLTNAWKKRGKKHEPSE